MKRRHFLRTGACAATLAWPTAWAQTARPEPLTSGHVSIASSLALSGPLGGAGQDHIVGAKAAFAAVNRAGGIHGRELRLDVQDDAYLPARTLDNLQRVVSEGSAFALMSTMGTGNTATILPLVEQAGIPLVGPVTGAHSLRLPSQKYTFHVRPSYRDEVARVTQELVTIGLKDIAVVYLDNPFGHEVRRDAQAGLEAQKVNAVGSWALAVDGRNAEEVVAHILASRAGAVFLGTTGTATTALVKSLRARAAGLPIAGLSVSVISSEIPKLGSSIRGVAVAAVMPDALQEKHPVVRSYQATLREAGVKDFGGSSFEGWLNAQVMIEGLRRAGRDLTRERLRAALAGLRSLDLGGFTLGYAGSAPFVASRFIELAVFGADGKRVG